MTYSNHIFCRFELETFFGGELRAFNVIQLVGSSCFRCTLGSRLPSELEKSYDKKVVQICVYVLCSFKKITLETNLEETLIKEKSSGTYRSCNSIELLISAINITFLNST